MEITLYQQFNQGIGAACLLQSISKSKITMQRAIMCFEQGASGHAGLEALAARWNAAQTYNGLCPKDLCGTAAPAALVRARGAPAHRGAKPPGICHRGATNIIHLRI